MKKFCLFVVSVLLIGILNTIIVNAEFTASGDDMNAYIANEFKKMHIPSMSVQFVNKDKVAFSENYGECESSDTPYILGSISKSFTAVAIMQLEEKGELALENSISSYLPQVDKGCKTTVKQLLNQTSGIETYMTLENFKTTDEVSDWEYANVNYNLLGMIVENVSGMNYGNYIKANIFEPLDMNNSYVSVEEAKDGGLIDGYRNYFGFMAAQDFSYPEDTQTGWMAVPAAYIISTANDMGKYLQAYLKAGEGILSENSIEKMFNETVFAADNYEYGYGWGIDKRMAEPMLVHGGNVENYTAYMCILPQRSQAFIVLTNGCDYFSANNMVVQTAYNIAYKLMDINNNDISSTSYISTHILLNMIMLAMLLTAVFPVIKFKKWHMANKNKVTVRSIIRTIILHMVVPTVFISIPRMLNTPYFVVSRFAPDICIIILTASSVLYACGIAKIIVMAVDRKTKTCV